jgi:hypothetical protein
MIMYESSNKSPAMLVTVLVAVCVIIFGFLYNVTAGSGYAGVIFIPLTIAFLLVDFVINIFVVKNAARNKSYDKDGLWLLFLPPLAPLACGYFFMSMF